MENNITTLTNILKDQYKTQYDLLEIEQKKTDVLIKGDVEILNDLMNTEQALLMNGNNLEKQREAVCLAMGIERFSLREIVNEYDQDNSKGLKTLLIEFTDIMFNLKKTGAINTKLLNARLQTVQYMCGKLNDLTGSAINEASLTYKKLH
ncbi:MAG: FlgN family protein [Clostridia bacterium]|nr:FlgN family protein [Clostridia bacterium]